ncbi:MAG: DUF4157 domain-containing protein [Lachnospiraceae bacterium]|nr:DUF4157 domain-containing protein [Lachnospiraceae bacterium]MCM1235305.1 DUF4157 domain-containing protein [Ruminococcus flavefaciens]
MECIKTLTAHLERALQILRNPAEPVLIAVKKESQPTEQRFTESAIWRNPNNDRVFPVDGQTLEEFNLNTGGGIEQAIIHTGSYADELARSLHSLALVIGTDIYFRSSAYKPETEEGRKTITHELIHVAQHKNRPLVDNRTMDEIEAEAETAEVCCPAMRGITIRGKKYRLTERQYRMLMQRLKEEVEDELEWLELTTRSKEYAPLMRAYHRLEERGELPWQTQGNTVVSI